MAPEYNYGWHEHQIPRQRLRYNHTDGSECDVCGEPMYRDKERNFDGATLEADHKHGDKTKPAYRLVHRRCNRSIANKWVEHGPGWYAKHGQPATETSDLDWPGGVIIDWDKVAPTR